MNPLHFLRSALGATAVTTTLLCAAANAQNPVNPPPWWRVGDLVTVSLYYDFSGPAPLQPVAAASVVPTWYNAAQTVWTLPPNVVILPTLTTHTDVLALVGNGTPQSALLTLRVDNDPHIDWVKIFSFQFDEFKGASGSVAANISKDLAKYGRAAVTEDDRVSIGGGWETVTITAKLIPQPDDEKLEWSLTENAFGTEAIDNLFVSSKCVKPGDDEKGEALGAVDTYLGDLFTATGTLECRSAAVTQGPGPTFARTYWVSSRSTTPGAFHSVFRLNQLGTVVGTTQLPDSVLAAPLGGADLTVAPGPTLGTEVVYVLVDGRPAGQVFLRAINPLTGLPEPTFDIQLPPIPIPPGQAVGLAFDPSGDFGAGTFWVSDQVGGTIYEFSRTFVPAIATLHTTVPITVSVPGAGFSGLGYDEKFGNFYGFSEQLRPSPLGPLRVNGFEWSGYDFNATGAEFVGNLNIPGLPQGGIASGLEVYRRGGSGDFRMVCVVRDPLTSHPHLYELKGPYRFGWSQMGTCGMQGGPPFEGGTSFAVTLRGVPNTVLAILYAGLSNTTFAGGPLPAPLAVLGPGFDESYLSVSLDVNLGGYPPISPGAFAAPVLLPPAGGLHYVPIFFQWIVLDTSVPGLMAMSQAGKTIAY